MQSTYKSILETEEMTVVSQYEPLKIDRTRYQSEAELEEEFMRRLIGNGYERLVVHDEKGLIDNLRLQIEKLNNYKFSDDEWQRLYDEHISNPNLGIVEKTITIQRDEVKTIKLDNGTSKNIKLLDKKIWFNNSLQVMNQYTNVGSHENRYDVTILVNGLPLIHIELKRRGVPIKEAFNQIERYQRESFWSNSGLYEFAQIFVISNGTLTKYYSNTTRWIKTNSSTGTKKQKSLNAFEFTSYWADSRNNTICSLEDFTNTFLTKRNLLFILFKYCVLTIDNELLVMRPYQICATERIIQRVAIAHNYKWYGSVKAGGYIWHTTGSGKTLTSFKTATILKDTEYIDKVLFVVDRKDLDYQTMKEYDRFEKGCANGNKSTSILEGQLLSEDPSKKLIVTTIQKLNVFIKKYKTHPIYQKHVVMIFDECHRSQFGEAHKNIVKSFKNYYLFGFTGTPIFPENANKANKSIFITTDATFGERLHTYTIIDAVRDDNVLKFLIDRAKTMTSKDGIRDEKVEAIDKEGALLDDRRINANTKYIIETYNRKCKRNEYYSFNKTTNIGEVATGKQRVQENKVLVSAAGFNGILACDSIPMAMRYYAAFKKIENNLKVAIIYSYAENEDPDGFFTDEENPEDTSYLDKTQKEFLEDAIRDYNLLFHTNYDTSSDKFQNYYKDVSLRMKNKEIDLLIVVNMFLTGFDAKTLNTLWVDKNLRYHGLLQAFSRTNRIFNEIKAYGNIVCFRNLDEEIEKTMALFGNKDAGGIILLKDYASYYNGFYDNSGVYHKGYKELVEYMTTTYNPTVIPLTTEEQKDFINSFNGILKVMNILSVFERFDNERLISDYDFQSYSSIYNELREKYRKDKKKEDVDITDDIVFETELVEQFEINIDYILMLLEKYKKNNMYEIIPTVKKLITASFELRSKKELIEAFIENIDSIDNVSEEWSAFIQKKAIEELNRIVSENNLDKKFTISFINSAFMDEKLNMSGDVLDRVIPHTSLFGGKRARKQEIGSVLQEYFDKYVGMVYTITGDNYV